MATCQKCPENKVAIPNTEKYAPQPATKRAVKANNAVNILRIYARTKRKKE
jgi:hypothetical protein